MSSPEPAKQTFPLPLRLIFEFVGGVLDGTAMIDREIEVGGKLFEEFAVATAYWMSAFGQVGKRFPIVSPGRLAHTAISEHGIGALDAYEYEITDRLEGDNELLLRARFIGQVAMQNVVTS